LRDSPPRFFEERARERPVTALRKKAVRCSCAAVEAPTSAVPSGPPAVLTRLQSQNPLYRPAGARTEPCAPASSILRLSIAFAACVSACSASTPLVAHPWPARPLRKPLNCLTSRSRAWAAPAYSRRPTLSLPGRTRARPSSSARLPRWTSRRSPHLCSIHSCFAWGCGGLPGPGRCSRDSSGGAAPRSMSGTLPGRAGGHGDWRLG
jgi:hypothetical protein